MLAIRMQRTGRKGHAMFRVVVQDSHRTPTSGKIVAQIGSYDPHAKTAILDKEKAGFYLEHGAQPSERVASLLKSEGVKLPKWVKLADKREGSVRNPDKRRSTRPEEPAAEEAPAAETAETAEAPEAPADTGPADTEAAPANEPESTEPAEPAEAESPAADTEAEAPAETKTEDSASEAPSEEAPAETEKSE